MCEVANMDRQIDAVWGIPMKAKSYRRILLL